MSRTQAVASSPPVTGVTRNVDLVMDSNSGKKEVGLGVDSVRENKSGTVGAANGITLNMSSVTWQILNGYPVVSVPSGLGNGACIQFGMQVQNSQAVALATPSAYSLRRGLWRWVTTIGAASLQAPNNDVGTMIMIGGGSITDLLPATGGGAGKTGFGIWMLANGWNWGMKKSTDLAGALSESVLIQADPTVLMETELRIYDSVPGGVAASNFARCELWINNLLSLTRYWTNPAGVVTPVLPPVSFAMYPQIRNTSTGPATVTFGSPSLIQGPNDTGTT